MKNKVDKQIKFLYDRIKNGKIGNEDAIKELFSLQVQYRKNKNILKENKQEPIIEESLFEEKAINYFIKLLSSVVKLPVNVIDADSPMEKYGIDSILVMQMTNQLEKVFGSLPKTLFFEYQNIKSLTKYFLENYRSQMVLLLGIEGKKMSPRTDSFQVINDTNVIVSQKTRPRFIINNNLYQHEKNALDIAIIGLSGRYPKANNIKEYWQNIKEGKDCITEIPPERWDHSLYFDEDKNKIGKTYTKWGGFIEGIDLFDPLFFNISPREAELMDPQERLFLECVYETIEDAGYTSELLTQKESGLGSNIAVFVGVMYEEYQLYGSQLTLQGNPIALSGISSSIANRVSYFFNFHGPSMVVNTMCSSSLSAIHIACQSIERGECDLAIAGGVNISIHPNKYLLLAQGKFASSKGKCESFGASGDGYVPGEGVGAILLKPLSKAIENRDHIYGIIKSSAVNHGGKTNGYTVPNPNLQAKLIKDALMRAKINARTISYIEAHGTGTSLGDPIEIAGLTKSFEEYTNDKQYCAIGSVKSNIGHCESAAGIAAVTKVLLQLKHKQIVPSLHSNALNPNIDFINTPFVVQQELGEWKRPVININGEFKEYPRMAGVSSFGAGGSNAHIIIEEYLQKTEIGNKISSKDPVIILLSAKNEGQLREQVKRLLEVIDEGEYTDNHLINIAYTLMVGREAMDERLAVIVKSLRDLEEKLRYFCEGQEGIDDLFLGQIKQNKETLSVFIEDEELKKAIDKWIEQKKYRRLLELWVKGLTVDWRKLYLNSNPQRVSLPTYPFAKERYWLPEVDPKFTNKTNHEKKIERVILVKNWQQKRPEGQFIKRGVVVVLGTKITKKISSNIFLNSDNVQVIEIIHNETADFYSTTESENIYQYILEKRKDNKILGLIDISSLDSDYERVIDIESGKIKLLQNLIEHNREDKFFILQVTHKLNKFHIPKTTMQGARLVGLYRMLGAEYKQIQSMTMDTDHSINDYKELIPQIETEFLNIEKDNLSECCYRDNQRFQPFYEILKKGNEIIDNTDIWKRFSLEDVLIITGGSRGIGASIAEYVVSLGVKKLVIIGREALPKPSEWKKIIQSKEKPEIEEKLIRMQSLIEQGVKIHYYNISLTDPEKLKIMVDEINLSLGPVTGVFHCAGLTSKTLAFFRKSITEIEEVCEPKIKGLLMLHKALENNPLEFFILFSSISSNSPQMAIGKSDYAMANAYMDFYATYQNVQGNTCFKAIQWPVWGETGMASRDSITSTYIGSGIEILSTKEGLSLLNCVMKTTYTVCLPCIINFNLFDSIQLLKKESKLSKRVMDNSLQLMLKTQPISVSPQETQQIRKFINQWLQDIFMSELKLTDNQFDKNKRFDEYGIDSIILIQLVNTMNELINKSLDPSLLLKYSTIEDLTDYFINNYFEDFQDIYGFQTDCASTSYIEKSLDNEKTSNNDTRDLYPTSEPVLSINPVSNKFISIQEDIAVIGISCRFPGSPTKKDYWDLLTKGRVAIKPVPEKRWISENHHLYYGGWVEGIDYFDSKFFRINEKDATIMDPQARVILEESLKVINDAGYEYRQLSGQKIGVYIGGRSQMNRDFSMICKAPNPILGIGQNYLATNISRFFNFTGPSLVIDSACSSGLTGMSFAVDALRGNRIDMALVGAVSLLLTPSTHELFAARNILSKNGKFHIFSMQSDGEVLGEGAGVVLLKRLNDAIKDGNNIYGVIKAITLNNDGRTIGPGSPNLNAQEQVMKDALLLSKKQINDIGYIEVNGGGSPVIDSIELKSLSDVYLLDNQELNRCFIGSVKPNVGHLLLASSMASFIRCLLSIYYKQIPPFLSATEPFQYYDFKKSRIQFNRETIHWEVPKDKKRVAAMNSFPDGGTNCHVIIEEFLPEEKYHETIFTTKNVPTMSGVIKDLETSHEKNADANLQIIINNIMKEFIIVPIKKLLKRKPKQVKVFHTKWGEIYESK